uniref:HDC00271 n=1 Tax=Drosophila melanogaster TaxID=7227 RepID=Q6IHZ1_DROME|nr:TPA_inf: HDC00271 [Drosophila melanogaster]
MNRTAPVKNKLKLCVQLEAGETDKQWPVFDPQDPPRQPRTIHVTNRSRQTAETADKDDNQLVNSRRRWRPPPNPLLPFSSKDLRRRSTAAAIKFP